MENKKQTQKPLILEIEEAKKDTTVAINEILQKHNLPCYLYEPIIADAYKQVASQAKIELQESANAYYKQKEVKEEVKETKK